MSRPRIIDLSEHEEEVGVMMELGSSNLQLEASVVDARMMKFKFVDILGDDSVALSGMVVKFRPKSLESLVNLKDVKLFVTLEDGRVMPLGEATQEADDPRDYSFQDWCPQAPLPLGNDIITRLSLVVSFDAEPNISPSEVSFQGQLIPFPEVFLINEPKMKRKLCGCTIRFRGGKITDVERDDETAVVRPAEEVSTVSKPKMLHWADFVGDGQRPISSAPKLYKRMDKSSLMQDI